MLSDATDSNDCCMRRINHPFIVLVILFSVYAATGYSQNIPASLKLTISATLEQTLAPQSIDLIKLTQAPDSMIALVEIKDGKKRPIAAQVEKIKRELQQQGIYMQIRNSRINITKQC
ncbi:MAG: hypothetical protein JWQ30_2518 [Sediminibacterium sp.]|nr:hypothetical protein [Sediminibacterium sp.]